MIWDKDKWNIKLLRLHRLLIKLRQKHEALRRLYIMLKFKGNKGVLALKKNGKRVADYSYEPHMLKQSKCIYR